MSHFHHVAVVRRIPCPVRSPMNKRGGGWLSTHAHQEPAPAGGAAGAQNDDDEAPTSKDATAHAYRLLSSLFAHSKTLVR